MKAASGEQFKVYLSHADEDEAVAEVVGAALLERGFSVARNRVVGSDDAGNVDHADAFVLILSEAAHNSEKVRADLAGPIANDMPIYPVRVDDTDLKGYLAYYLQIAQWIDLDPKGIEATLDHLAKALMSETAGRGTYAGGTPGTIFSRHPRATALAAALPLLLAIVVWLWGERLIDAIEKARFNLANYAFSMSFREDQADFPGTTWSATLFLDGLPRYDLPVRAAVYDAPPDGPIRKLGSAEELPEVVAGHGSMHLLVAEIPKYPVACLVFVLEDGDLAHALLRRDPEIAGAMAIEAGRRNGQNCDALLGGAVDTAPLDEVKRTRVLLEVEASQKFDMVSRIKVNDGSIRVEKKSVGEHRGLRFDSHVFIYGGPTLDQLTSLAADSVFFGQVPLLLRVCLETRVAHSGWPMVTQIVDFNTATKTIDSSTVSLEGESICKSVAGANAAFPEDLSPEMSARALPWGSGGRFSAGGESPALAGITLGMPFEEARVAMTEVLPFAVEIDASPDRIDGFHWSFLGLKEPSLTLGERRRVTLEDKKLGMRLSVIAGVDNQKVAGVWATWRPNGSEGKEALATVSRDAFREALRAAFGEPSSGPSEPSSHFFTQVWSPHGAEPCKAVASEPLEQGYSIRRKHTVCKPHVAAQFEVEVGQRPVYRLRMMGTSG